MKRNILIIGDAGCGGSHGVRLHVNSYPDYMKYSKKCTLTDKICADSIPYLLRSCACARA